MARIWFAYEGLRATRGGPSYDLSAEECVEKLALSRDGFLSDLEHPPKFDDPKGLGEIAGYKYAVVELNSIEAASIRWRPGFYRSPLSPEQVIERLGRPPKDPWDVE